MKKLLIIAMLATSLSSFAQSMLPMNPSNNHMTYGDNWKENLEYTVPIGFLLSGFAINECYISNNAFTELSQVEKHQNTFKVYGTTAICTVGSHYLIKWLETKPFKKKKFHYKHKF